MSVVGITMGLANPLLSLIMEARGYSRTVIGLNTAVLATAMLIFSPLIPRLVGRLGLRAFLVGCVCTESAMFLILKVVDDVYLWFPIRFVMGASTAGLFVASETWINQLAQRHSRGRLMAVYNMVLSAGFALGPVIIPITGIDGWAPFVVGAAIVLLGVIPLAWAGHLAPSLQGKASFSVLSFVRVAPTLAAAVLIFAVLEAAASSLLPVYGVRSGLGENAAALMLTVLLVGSIAMQLPVGWLADKLDRYAVMLMCGLAGVVGSLMVPRIITIDFLLWPNLFIWGGFVAGIYTVAMAILGDRFRGAELITANAAFGVLWGLGCILGPTLGGISMDIWDPHGLPGVMAAACGIFVAVLLWRHRVVRVLRRADA